MRQDVSKRTIVVLGATGRTGRHVVQRARAEGFAVVAPVRREGGFASVSGVREVSWPAVDDAAALIPALAGADAVITALGGAPSGVTTVCTDATRALIAAMPVAGVRRLVAVSAHGVGDTHDRSLYARAVWAGVGEKMKDKDAMESLVEVSDLDWTLVRPPTLRNGRPGGYRAGEDLRIRLWHSLSRADLADFLVREVTDGQFVHRRPRVRR